MNKITWIATTLSITIVGISILFIYLNKPIVAYIDLEVVFAEFNGKKELEAKFMQGKNLQKATLDSMALEIKFLNNQSNQKRNTKTVFTSLEKKQNNYVQKANEFAGYTQQQEAQLTEKIWSQINQYVYDYGEANGYDFIYGLNQTGNLMFAKKDKNITTQVIDYINQRYEGL